MRASIKVIIFYIMVFIEGELVSESAVWITLYEACQISSREAVVVCFYIQIKILTSTDRVSRCSIIFRSFIRNYG